MNQIEVKSVMTPWGYEQEYPTVDGKTIAAHLSEWMASENETDCEWLYPAWGNALLVTAEKNLIWHLIDCEDTVNVPILVCEDDLDLSCIVVLAKIRKTQNRVYWDAVGFWRKEHCTDDIRLYGILHHESYSDEDWVRYGGHIACAGIDSEEWRQWIGDHWEEENRRLFSAIDYICKYDDDRQQTDKEAYARRVGAAERGAADVAAQGHRLGTDARRHHRRL